MTLFERQHLLDELNMHLASVSRGRGVLVSIVGEAGAGKTALVRKFADGLANQARVLWGACEDLSTPEPLGPLRDLARAAKRQMPELDGGAPRLTIFSRALDILDDGLTLAIIEDLHWADDATVDLVRYLGRRIRDSHILLVVTARDDDADAQARLRRMLVDVPADNHAHIEIPRLSPTAVTALARDAGCDAADLFATTGGNAFFVSEVLRGSAKETLPATVRDAVLRRTGRLSDGARAVLDCASIFPRRVEPQVLATICLPDSADDIEDCISAGMLQRCGGDFAFRHEIARRTIEAALAPARRRALNARALEVLRSSGQAAVARLVHHAQEAQDLAVVRELAPKAAQEAARAEAHREAARHYATALAHAGGYDIAERARLYEECSFELHLIGRLDEAIGAREAELALRRESGDRLREGDALRWLSRLHYMADDRALADRLAREAVVRLEALPPCGELAMAYSNLSHIAMLSDRAAEAIAWGEKAIALAGKLAGEHLVLSHAYNNVGTAKQWRDPAAARADLERSLRIALASGCGGAQLHAARAFTNYACVEVNLRDNRRAHALLEDGIAYCVERNLDIWVDYMRGWRAELLAREARWDEAVRTARAVVASASATQLVRNPAVLVLARVHMRRGDADVVSLLDDLAAYRERGMEGPRLCAYAALAAEHAWLTQAEPATVLPLLQQGAELAANAGHMWLSGEIEFWRRKLLPGSNAAQPETLAEPYRLLFAGDWAGAAQAWLELHAPYEQALALLQGDEGAQRRALDILNALGVTASAERVRAELRDRGLRNIARGPRASTRANVAGLTRRQMDVLGLINRGLSNAEIAESLFVSPKTIDHHVSAILAKLEAGSRGEAAAIARNAGLIATEKAPPPELRQR